MGNRNARLYFYYAVMKANKSLELITTAQKYGFQNKKALIFKPTRFLFDFWI